MIDALADLVIAFPGAANRTRCFAHILNLVVKVILRQFDVPKSKANEELDLASRALAELAGDIEMEGKVMDESVDDDDDDDKEVGWVDPRDGMSQDDQDDLDLSVRPLRLVLVKVSSNSVQTLMTGTNKHEPSYENLRMQSKTPQPSSFLAGFKFSKNSQIMLNSLTGFLSPFG
jgi:hypothetical protein